MCQRVRVHKAALSADCKFGQTLMLRPQRMSGLTGRNAAWPMVSQWPVWAVSEDGPAKLYFDSFCDGQRVLKFDAQISNRTVHLRMSKKQLDGAKVASLLVDLGYFSASH